VKKAFRTEQDHHRQRRKAVWPSGDVLAIDWGLLPGTVTNVVIPTADYIRFATHYRFRPDFCHPADPESKGIVENLVGYAKRDFVLPASDDLTADRSG